MPGRPYLVRWIGRRARWAVLRAGQEEEEPIALYERKLDAVSLASGLADADEVPLVIDDEEPGPGGRSDPGSAAPGPAGP